MATSVHNLQQLVIRLINLVKKLTRVKSLILPTELAILLTMRYDYRYYLQYYNLLYLLYDTIRDLSYL